MRRRGIALQLLLAALVIGVYWGIGTHAFVDFDDGEYVVDNPIVRAGLTPRGALWALTTPYAANWFPLTWLSHMLDVQLFGLDPGWHHRVSLLIHLLNTLLVFRLFREMTGESGPSALVAALFGIHPLHVESVAWVAERKDVLSGFFFLLTVRAYVRWTRSPRFGRAAAALALFALGLMAKQMLVTVPFVLLLLDVWPLGRLRGLAPGRPTESRPLGAGLGKLVREKIPYFLASAAASAVAYFVQSAGRATASSTAYPIGHRIANALVSCVLYLRNTFWPSGLAAFYPHPDTIGEPISPARAAAAAALLLAVTALALWRIRPQPYLAVGWLWFLGMLVPVIGLVQIGSQARADRYTYLPLLGIFAAVSWGGRDLLRRWRVPARAARAAGIAVVLALAVSARVQAAVWRDGVSLYSHALSVTEKNWLAWNNLGMQQLGSPDEAIRCFREAIAIRPDYADAWYNMGIALGSENRHAEAAACYRAGLGFDPKNADGWVNLANEDRALGNPAAAAADAEAALKIRPGDPLALSGLVLSDEARGEPRRAAEDLARLRAVDPAAADALEVRLRPSP